MPRSKAVCTTTHRCVTGKHKNCPFTTGKCEHEGGCDEKVPGNRKHKSRCEAHSKAMISNDTARSRLTKSAEQIKDGHTLEWLASDEGKAASADEYNKRRSSLDAKGDVEKKALAIVLEIYPAVHVGGTHSSDSASNASSSQLR